MDCLHFLPLILLRASVAFVLCGSPPPPLIFWPACRCGDRTPPPVSAHFFPLTFLGRRDDFRIAATEAPENHDVRTVSFPLHLMGSSQPFFYFSSANWKPPYNFSPFFLPPQRCYLPPVGTVCCFLGDKFIPFSLLVLMDGVTLLYIFFPELIFTDSSLRFFF